MRCAEQTQWNQILHGVVGNHATPVLRLEGRLAVGLVDVDDHDAEVGRHEEGRTVLVEDGYGQKGENLRKRERGIVPSSGR